MTIAHRRFKTSMTLARLQDQLTNVSWFTRCCVATDLVGEEALDVNTAYALLVGTANLWPPRSPWPNHVAPIVKMMDMAEGREGAFSERPWLAAHISPDDLAPAIWGGCGRGLF